MKAAAWSDMQEHHGLLGFWGALVAIVSAGLGAAGLWLANRTLGRAAFQTAINQGFKELTDALAKERDQLRETLTQERVAWEQERSQLRGDIANLTQAVESLKHLLRREGIDIPETPPKAHPPPMLMLPGRSAPETDR